MAVSKDQNPGFAEALIDPAVTSYSRREYLEVVGVISLVTLAGWFAPVAVTYLALGQVYLLAVIVLCLRVGRWPVFFAGILSAVAWDYLIIPPRFSFRVTRVEDALMLGTFCLVALIAGQLTARIREQELRERYRERRATGLFHFTRAITAAHTFDEAVAAGLTQAGGLFGGASALATVTTSADGLLVHPASSLALGEIELEIVQDVRRFRREAGRFSPLHPTSPLVYFPVLRGEYCLGIFVLRLPTQTSLTLFSRCRDVIAVFTSQFGLLIEREQLRLASEREKMLAESEKLHRTLLDSVSHELKTPLAVLRTAASRLQSADGIRRELFLTELRTAVGRLDTLVENLINQTKLEAGALHPRLDWCNLRDIVNSAQSRLAEVVTPDHPVKVDIPGDLPLLRANPRLLEQALVNLLHNAHRHTPAGTQVVVAARVRREDPPRIEISVADRGPGLPPEILANPFQKFRATEARKAGGLGLGLSIVRGVVAAQGGEVGVQSAAGGGACFSITFPYQSHGDVPDE